MRHGERADHAFGDWTTQCFDKNGNYFQTDLNMPEIVPKRSGVHNAYLKDSPLTKIGIFQAQLTGEAFKKAQINISHVYSSPSLRCIQTSHAFLEGCGKNDIKIKVEPGLYEWWAFFGDSLAEWLTPKELTTWGYNIDLEYQPIISVDTLGSKKETCAEYCSRNLVVSTQAMKAHSHGNVLLVAHGSTVAVCSWELRGKKIKLTQDAIDVIVAIPYCGFIELSQCGDKWKNERPFLQLSHTSNAVFDYSRLF
ncbi:hypothetical protein Zmor_020105 [Zophobas morio]|uniref:Uncharacterized protein n=2 Tax=Zophobas morio TaxID=2755281 RepID=A0AA38M9Z9_9CUCU|nr:hypothetical protein Zmor_020105 [Zophobas morio]